MLSTLLSGSIGFRTLSKAIKIENAFYKDYPKTPSHTTLSNWIYKVGYHELTVKKIKTNWIIILDHSIQMGVSKILVIYGIPTNKLDFSRALTYTDLTPLRIKILDKWKWEDVRYELLELKKEIGNITYAVADHESLLKKALEEASIVHIHDVTHKIALLFEKRYKQDETYKRLTEEVSHMRSKCVQSELAHLIPLSVRKKSIFQNIGKMATWAYKCIRAFEQGALNEKEEAVLSFLVPYKSFILELYRLNELITGMEKILKTAGLSRTTIQQVYSLVHTKSKDLSAQGKLLLSELILYMKDSFMKVKGKGILLCTSDIIESAFGKYKNCSSDNKMACVTRMVLFLAAITVNPEPDKIKQIFETVKMANVNEWVLKNIGTTSYKKRVKLFSDKKIA